MATSDTTAPSVTPGDSVGAQNEQLGQMYDAFQQADVQGLWTMPGLLTPVPRPSAVPHRWDGRTLRALADQARELVSIDRGGDRRVLACVNPGLGGAPYATNTLWAAVQALGPGERAPAHRHTPAALRFVLSGDGVWTAVDGDPLSMSTGDLILTPSWTFHEHFNPGTSPMTWLDVLDLPMVAYLDAVFFEAGAGEPVSGQPARSDAEHWFGGGPGLLPLPGRTHAVAGRSRSPLLAYRWVDTDRALNGQLAQQPDRIAAVRYADPSTGRDVMPTLRCEMFRVPPQASPERWRQTGSRVLSVLNGLGHVRVGDQSFPLAPGDIIAVPSWTPIVFEADSTLDIFSVSDEVVLEALGLSRRETSTDAS